MLFYHWAAQMTRSIVESEENVTDRKTKADSRTVKHFKKKKS